MVQAGWPFRVIGNGPAGRVIGSVGLSGWRSCWAGIRSLSYAEIARRVGRDKAVVWREVHRNRNC